MALDGQLAAHDPMLRRGPFLAVLRQGLPLALGLASHGLINLVNLVFVGRLGAGAIQAAHVASTWNFLPMIVGNCVSTALLAQLARRLGEGEVDAARRLHRRAQWFMLWFGAVVAAATTLPAAWMVDGTGLHGAPRDEAVYYLVVSNLGCLPMFVLMQTTAAMRAAGEALVPLLLLLGANLVNLGLDLVLLFGWDALGIPSFGVVGAAYASVIARGLAAALAFLWLCRRRHVLSLRSVPEGPGPRAVALSLLADSWPLVLQIGLRAGLVLGLTVVAQHRFGDDTTVALGVTTRLDTLVLFGSLGFANAATAYAGRAVVLGHVGAARRAGAAAALLAGLFGAALVLCFQAFSAPMTYWFLPDATAAVAAGTALYIGIAAWSQVLGAAALGAIGAVHGSGRMVAPLVVDLVGFLGVAVLVAIALGRDGLEQVYWALVAGMGFVAALHLAFVAVGRWPRV